MDYVPGQCLDAVDLDRPPDLMKQIAASSLAGSHSALSTDPGSSRWWTTMGLHLRRRWVQYRLQYCI